MRTKMLTLISFGVLALTAYLAAQPGKTDVQLKLRLVDSETGKGIAGIVRVYAQGSDKPLSLGGLLPRMRGLRVSDDVAGWHVVPAAGAAIKLPRTKIKLEALSGLESGLTRQTLDLRGRAQTEVSLRLDFHHRPKKAKLYPGNTHLHLQKLSKEEAEEYLRKIPAADGLSVLFISYLERHQADKEYITNKYPIGDLPQFSSTGVLVNNGEEHRHNFKGFGQGYGHVMLLGIKNLVKPVSIGPGIMADGFDDTPLRRGIDNARQQGGTIIWCHNTFGYEDVLNALSGRLHGLNFFDGSRRDTFEDAWYRYLNVGVRMPVSTGTDWFMYDFSRVYAKVPGKLTIKSWLAALKAGRNVATNGPILSLKVDGKEIGDTITFKKPRTVRIEAEAIGRQDFQHLELVQNGRVVRTTKSKAKAPYRAKLVHEVRVAQPTWFAVRIKSSKNNELGKKLYAHTSPVYIDFDRETVFDVDAARALLRQIEEGHAAIKAQGRFSSPKAARRVLSLYEKGAENLRQRIEKRSKR